MPKATLDLGPFRLDRQIGRGTTAEVWSAVHRATGSPVVVKALIGLGPAHQAAWLRRLEEVRAVARLEHRNIIRLHDYGEIPPALADASGGALPAGTPFLVMDRHSAGTLDDHKGRLDFAHLRTTLLTVLEALAHAHARGVIHRDLKPANVLLGPEGPVVSDFGVMFDVDARLGDRTLTGTPNYMAPEQVINDWRQFGPWTDLYAVGCLAWALVTGRPPFAGRGAGGAMWAQLRDAPPVLRARTWLPRAFGAWLGRLLHKAPERRFQCAADAAVALIAMDSSSALGAQARPPTGPDGPPAAYAMAPRAAVFVRLDERAWEAGPRPDGRPPMPADWRRPDPPWPGHLTGPGRALAGLREARLRGRAPERDALWAALGRVAAGGGAQVVVLDGAAGQGKTRLMRWLGRRAHALGQAEVVSATHAPVAGPAHGLAAALVRRLRIDGLEPEPARQRVRGQLGLDPASVAAIVALGQPDATAELDDAAVSLGDESERAEAVIDGLRALCERRPQVVQIDDAQWGAPATRVVERVLSHHPDLPLLFVLTVRTDPRGHPTAPPPDADPLARLLETPRVTRRRLGPLDPDAQLEIAAARLPLAPEALRRLVETAAGNPLFAGELVRYWLQSDALVEGSTGYGLRPAHSAAVPRTLADLWGIRLDALLGELAPDPRPALELAAVLGVAVDRDEWAAARSSAGTPWSDRAERRLLDAGLMRSTPAGRLVFVHALLRESLQARALGQGRAARWHAASAEAVAGVAERRGRRPDLARLATHLDAAGQWAAAFTRWMQAAYGLSANRDLTAAGPLLIRAARAGRRLHMARTDRRWIDLQLAWAARLFGGRWPGAARHVRRAVAGAQAAGEPVLEGRALRLQARLMFAAGDADGAMAHLETAEALFDAAGSRRWLGSVRVDRAALALRRGHLDEADRAVDAALKVLSADDGCTRRVEALGTRAELARARGDLDAAERAYGEALDLLGHRQSLFRAILVANQAIVHLARGAIDRAEADGRWLYGRATRAGHPVYAAFAQLILLVCAAERGDVDAWDRAWGALELVVSMNMVEADTAHLLERAGEAARRALPERAAAARALAAQQYAALDRPAEAAALASRA